MSFGTLLTTCDLPAVEATANSPKNDTKGFAYRSFGAQFCEVRVNRWTGEPRVSRWVSVVDAGTIVNSKTARSQIIGGVLMGIGQALLEEVRMGRDGNWPRRPGQVTGQSRRWEPSGRFSNANLASYLVPVHADTPRMEVRFVNHPDTTLSELGARGIGELGIVGVTAALAGAVHHATGKRIRDLPITLDKLLD
jgi:xanthine dehydrogenase YagR molybdenum-binding subunit